MAREITIGFPPEAVLAQFIMSSEDTGQKSSIKKDWDPKGRSGAKKPALFKPEEMDIYCNKVTREVFIFHGKQIDYDKLDHLEYNAADHTVDVVMKDATRLDLGVKIQWLVRPYFTKAPEIMVVQTKDGESINGVSLPLKHKEKN
jgi:hypothetical protein